MNISDLLIIWIIAVCCTALLITTDRIEGNRVIAAINDSGCASHQPPAPAHKTNIEAYNLDSLKGNK